MRLAIHSMNKRESTGKLSRERSLPVNYEILSLIYWEFIWRRNSIAKSLVA